MKYSKFIIKNYKGISQELEIDLSKKSLVPIIGVNECGKTTILNAICAFDYFNDDINDKVRHLTDVKNLYKINKDPAEIVAEINISAEDLKEIIKKYYKGLSEDVKKNRRKNITINKAFKSKVVISRTIENENDYTYTLIEPKFSLSEEEHEDICVCIISNLPYILYFDDFRDSFPEEIEIPESEPESDSNNWLDYIERLFEKTNEDYSVYDLQELENRQRRSVLSDVTKKLNETLIKEWTNFNLDDNDPLSISIIYEEKDIPNALGRPNKKRSFLKFEIIERDIENNERFFYVRDRSKGFYWFFNFVMKLEFNHRRMGSDYDAIYLLDEPGSYLHPYAQTKLCKKLKELSETNKVLFCTHSHYLLNPEIIPLSNIQITAKNSDGNIQLVPYHSYHSTSKTQENSFQTIYDALQLRPFLLDISIKNIVLVEGIYDYYSFSLFQTNSAFNFLPGKSAKSLIDLISMMIGFRIDYRVVWDNDDEGNEFYKKAIRYFGEEQAKNRFFTLETRSKKHKRIIQDLFEGTDILLIKEKLKLDKSTSFEKMIAALFFSSEKQKIVNLVSDKTKSNFNEIFEMIKL